MEEGPNQAPESDLKAVDSDRREFLRNSIYAAYATPLITTLLVAEESAAASKPEKCSYEWCLTRNAKCCRRYR